MKYPEKNKIKQKINDNNKHKPINKLTEKQKNRIKKNLTITATERKKKSIHKLTHNHKQVILSSIFYTEDTIWLLLR